jgi:hypothetical protein
MAATILLGFELLVLPALVAVALVLILPRSVGPTPVGLNHRGWLGRSALALVPLGVVMWVVHYQFHFVTSWAAIIPISHRALLDVSGGSLEGLLGTPSWSAACCAPVPPWLLEVEILLLNLGFVMSWAIAFAFARAALPGARTSRVLLGILPLGVVQFALLLWGIWIVLQPMQMRGTLLP